VTEPRNTARVAGDRGFQHSQIKRAAVVPSHRFTAAIHPVALLCRRSRVESLHPRTTETRNRGRLLLRERRERYASTTRVYQTRETVRLPGEHRLLRSPAHERDDRPPAERYGAGGRRPAVLTWMRLQRGASGDDVACGCGAATIVQRSLMRSRNHARSSWSRGSRRASPR
jgi:hypothetical protein